MNRVQVRSKPENRREIGVGCDEKQYHKTAQRARIGGLAGYHGNDRTMLEQQLDFPLRKIWICNVLLWYICAVGIGNPG
jgi:hypothetical protein